VDVVHYCPGPNTVRKQLGIPKDSPVVGFVGRLTCDKGVPELLTAFDLVLVHYPQARLLLVGWFDAAEDALPAALRRRIESDPRIVVTGLTHSTRDYYRAMDLMVLPSLREGFPNAVLEASATGIPVITTLATGARDSVIPEVTGFLVPPGYPEAIAESVLALLDDEERRLKMGCAARAWVLENFVDAQVLALTVKFFKELLESQTDNPGHNQSRRWKNAPEAPATRSAADAMSTEDDATSRCQTSLPASAKSMYASESELIPR
jgi:glycosyltransferase involved in cell wall biosynthesis